MKKSRLIKQKMSDNRKVICAGCQNHYLLTQTTVYRKKRWCGQENCLQIIDKKVTNFNYNKQQKKIKNGTFRHGVPILIKQEIIQRDKNICKMCNKECPEFKAQVHHIIPVSNKGKDEHSNLILLCSDCHLKVHNKGWENFVTKLQKKIN